MTRAGVIPLKRIQGADAEITEEIVVGKDVLDLLTGAMYVDPLSIYREYIQNSADAIREAKKADYYSTSNPPEVHVNVDVKLRNVTIRDNGIGVPQKEFVRRLTAIGASKKRGTDLRGFRGVGRLSGLGYCQELVFRSRALGDLKVFELTWDGRKLKELLRDEQHAELTQAIRSIAKTKLIPADEYPPHFFEVELRSVRRVQNDLLLNEDAIHAYISQVAPVPFAPDFPFGVAIAEFLSRYTECDTIDIVLSGNRRIFRPHAKQFPIAEKVSDTFSGITFLEIPGTEDGIDAVGWILTHSNLGAIPKRALVGGLRARVGNMQVGTAELFDALFPQPRFNSWSVGEIHVLTKRILPNGRRDDFEVNAHLQNLHGHLAKTAKDLVKLCRDKSIIRNRLKSAALLAESVAQCIALLEKDEFAELRRYLESHTSKLIEQLGLLAKSDSLTEMERAVVDEQSRTLATRAQKATHKPNRRRDAFSKIGSAKRRAYEDAIDTILGSPLPITVRADLAQRVIRRAVTK